MALETHPRGGAAGNQCDHMDTGRKTNQTGFEGEISNPTACLGLCAKNCPKFTRTMSDLKIRNRNY